MRGKLFKKLAIICMSVCLMVPTPITQVMAESTVTTSIGSCTVSIPKGYLPLRDSADKDGNEIAKLRNGDQLSIINKDNSEYWYVHSIDQNLDGYAKSKYLSESTSTTGSATTSAYGTGTALPNSSTASTRSSSSASSGTTYTVSVATGYLALRTAPAYDYANEIGSLYTGDTITITDKSNSQYWWGYSPKYGRSGYVNKDYLVGASSSTSTSTSSGTTYKVSVATGYLALRTAPAYDYANEIGSLYTGDTITITDKSNSQYWWGYSPKYGRSGYVNKDYLVGANSSTSTSTSSGTTYTVSVATGYLALRTAPSYNEANEIGELYTGDTITITDKSNGQYWWGYSPKYGRSGYVNKDYLY